jgi:hypothetical protein
VRERGGEGEGEAELQHEVTSCAGQAGNAIEGGTSWRPLMHIRVHARARTRSTTAEIYWLGSPR